MEKITKILTKILIFIISILCIIYFFIFCFQKSITKHFVSSILENTKTSELLIHYTDNGSKLITIQDYISKNLDVFGVKENAISKEIINNYVENLTDAILSDVVYNYINNEELVINTNYVEVSELSKFLTKEQQEKLNNTIENINKEIIKYMDKTFEENRELYLVKKLNNFNTKILLIVICILIIVTLLISREKLKTIKSLIYMLILFIILIFIFNIAYKFFFSDMLLKMEKYGNSFQIFCNTFISNLNEIWKKLVIIMVIFSILYIAFKQASKKMSI